MNKHDLLYTFVIFTIAFIFLSMVTCMAYDLVGGLV